MLLVVLDRFQTVGRGDDLVAQLAQELLLQGQRAAPRAALAAGYRFRFDALEPALRAALGR